MDAHTEWFDDKDKKRMFMQSIRQYSQRLASETPNPDQVTRDPLHNYAEVVVSDGAENQFLFRHESDELKNYRVVFEAQADGKHLWHNLSMVDVNTIRD